MNDPKATPYECIDAAVGERLWRREQPDLDPTEKAILDAHLEACQACRLLVRVDEGAQRLGREARLAAPGAARATRADASRNGHARVRWAAGLAFAASLVAMLVLPPRPASPGRSVRGSEVVRFTAPVEGEIVATPRPVLRWTPLRGATRYVVTLIDDGGRAAWSGETATPMIRLPESAALVRGRLYRALLSVRPADLAPPVPASVAFRRETPVRVLLHRLRWSHPLLQAATALAFAVLAIAGARRGAVRARP